MEDPRYLGDTGGSASKAFTLGYYWAIYLTVKNQGIRELFSNRIIESAPAELLLLG
jgi:hypothetical protein